MSFAVASTGELTQGEPGNTPEIRYQIMGKFGGGSLWVNPLMHVCYEMSNILWLN